MVAEGRVVAVSSEGCLDTKEEVQQSPTMYNSTHDSRTFRRSQRLQSILGKMRDNREDECHLIGLPPTKASDSQSSAVINNNSIGQAESENDSAKDRSSPDPHPASNAPEVSNEGGKMTTGDETWVPKEDEAALDSREDVPTEQREDEIREQINVVIRDSIVADSKEAEEKESAFSFADEDLKSRSARKKSPRQSNLIFPERSSKNTSPRSPRSNPQSPRKKRHSPRSTWRTNTRKSPQEEKRNDNFSESDSSDDHLSIEGKLASDQKRPVIPRRPPVARGSKAKHLKRFNMKAKSVSSEDPDSSDSSANATYLSDSSTEGYSTGSSKKRPLDEQAVVASSTAAMLSPMAIQAGELVTKFVDQLKLHKTFGLPEKIKNHAKSQPLSPVEDVSDESRLDDESNSIVKNNGNSHAQIERPASVPKLATLPRRDVMKELREKLAKRKNSAATASNLPGTTSAKQERRKKLTSQVLKDTETAIETIPRLVSTDTGSTRTYLKNDGGWGMGGCGTLFACFDETQMEILKPHRIEWHRGDFLTVEEAMVALDNSDNGEKGSTIRSVQGPATATDLVPVSGDDARLNKDAEMPNTQLTPYLTVDQEEGDILSRVNPTLPSNMEPKSNDDDDDDASLSYSDASDDGSMVALRHGERETTKPSRPNANSEQNDIGSESPPCITTDVRQRKPPPPSPEDFSRLCRISPDERKPLEKPAEADMDLILGLSGQSNHVYAQCNDTPPMQQLEQPLHNAGSRTKIPNGGYNITEHEERHQRELQAKIKESHSRRRASDENGNSAVSQFCMADSTREAPIPTDLPVATKKIAQAYVDALSRKFDSPGKQNPSRSSNVKLSYEAMEAALTDLSDDVIPSPGMWKNRAAVCTTEYNPKFSNTMCHAGHDSGIAAVQAAQDHGVNVDDLVSRIDNVVQALIKAGKINLSPAATSDAAPQQQIFRNNTEELLHNLAILRARRELGSSSGITEKPPTRNSQYQSNPDNSFRVHPPVTSKTTGTPLVENTSLSAKKCNVKQESKSLQMLRAKRDLAAIAVRKSAERLSGWSTDDSERAISSEDTSTIPKSRPEGVQISRSFSSAKLVGPPRPESLAKRPSTAKSSLAEPIQHVTGREKKSHTNRAEPAKNARRKIGGRLGSPLLFSLPSDPSSPGLTSWAQEQLNELPVLLQETLSGSHGPAQCDDDASQTTGSDQFGEDDTDGTDDTDTVEDETTEYGSEDDTERLDRIENMIQELRARRMKL